MVHHAMLRPDFAYTPIVHNSNAVAEPVCLVDVVAYVENGPPDTPRTARSGFARASFFRWASSAENGSSSMSDPRAGSKHAGKGNTLLLASRKLGGKALSIPIRPKRFNCSPTIRFFSDSARPRSMPAATFCSTVMFGKSM